MDDTLTRRQRQIVYWRLISACYGLHESAPSLEKLIAELGAELDLPPSILDGSMSIEVLLHRHKKLKPHYESLQEITLNPGSEAEAQDEEAEENDSEREATVAAESSAPTELTEQDLQRSMMYSKLLLNVFGPNTRHGSTSAAQYNQWCADVAALEECFGFGAGELRAGGGGGTPGKSGGPPGGGFTEYNPNTHGGGTSGQAPRIDDSQLAEELIAMESDLIKRMEIREVLKDDRLAAKLAPTLPLVEQLLYDKSNLSGPALKNAKRLIKKYVDDLAAVLKNEVAAATSGKIDRSVPPKRIFRNLDIKRTVWKNLHNFNPKDERLYVDQLYYKHTSQKSLNKYLIVVVDQSGSMVSAMVQCAILASIFASLPRIKVSLVAFDTNVIDLTDWVEDPFESLMRTNLGGGNDGPLAMAHAKTLIQDPRRTTMVWISDFYEFQNDKPLFEMIKAVKESGVTFIPVGSVSGKGYFSVNEWFRKALKGIGLPVLTGNIKKLIGELKKHLD